MREELKAAREALGWTQQQLGEAAGLPATLVCSVERGAAERMALAMVQPLRERVTASLDAEPDVEAAALLRGLKRVTV